MTPNFADFHQRLTWSLVAIAVVSVAVCASPADTNAATQCGHVASKYGRFSVAVVGGQVRCGVARRVIRFVLTHGPSTQGAPGKSPPHWSCGWGYGYYHGNRDQSARSGPLCTQDSREVEGTGPGFTLKPAYRTQLDRGMLVSRKRLSHKCPLGQNLHPSNEHGGPGVSRVSVQHIPCRTAERVIRHGRIITESTGSSAPGEGFTYDLRARGFSCKPLTGGIGGATIQCSHRRRSFRFTYGT